MSELAATPDLVPVRSPAAGARSAKGGNVLQGVRSFIAQPAVAKSLPAIGFIALLGLAALLWMAFSAAPQRALFSGLGDEEKGAVVEALRTAGMDYSVDSSTGTIMVSEDDYYQARMQLASQGLPRGGPDGGDVIENLPLGASRAVETERIRSSREMDLARTIEGIDVVQSARVHLAVEQPSVFVRNRAEPAASVMLTMAPGRTLGDSQVQAIIHLVSSSVPNLSPDGVSIVDQNGRLLSRQGGEGPGAASDRQIGVQNAIEDRYRQSIATMLTPILGAGNFTAEVHADVDFSEVQSTREGFPENARALRSEEGQISTDPATGQAPGGIPGALSNTPPPAAEIAAAPPEGTDVAAEEIAAAAAAAGVAVTPRTENYNRSFAVGREVSVTRQQTPTVRRVSVAVALRTEGGQARSRQDIAALEQLVKGAVGFDQARGDVVAITARPFASADAPEAAWWEAGWVSMLVRNLTGLLVALLVIFGLARPLLRKAGTFVAQRAEAGRHSRAKVGGEIAAVIADQARTDPETRITLEMIEANSNYEARAALIRKFVRQDPARAALVVRDLIRADAKTGA